MDVEDPFGEHADDAALDIAELFTSVGVRGTFPITGEKCRKLTERNRKDVAAAFSPHALGLHTNTHSFHPTTMELLADKGWDDGCAAALASEQPGLDAFMALFERTPCLWAGAGFTWGPQIAGILPALSIPAYIYALTSAGRGRPHTFAGTWGFPRCTGAGEAEYESTGSTDAAIERILSLLDSWPAPWASLFLGHPTRVRYEGFWDVPFYDGVDPVEYQSPEPKTQERYEACLDNLHRLIAEIAAAHPVLGFDDVLALPWTEVELRDLERKEAEEETVQAIRDRAAGWPVNRRGLPTHRLEAETLARFDTVKALELP